MKNNFGRVFPSYIAWKVCKYGVISGPYFPVFNPNTGKYEPEITPYLDTFHAMLYFDRNFKWLS